MNFQDFKRKLTIWYLAHFKNKPYWIVICKSGIKIMFLKKKEAKKAKKNHKGKMKIYYSVNLPIKK